MDTGLVVSVVAFVAGLFMVRALTVRLHEAYVHRLRDGRVPRYLATLERLRAYSAHEEFIGDHPEWVDSIRAAHEPVA